MMISPASGSDPAGFGQLHPIIQRWIYQQGWTRLRDAQERAIKPILDGDRDVIISAATAAGKTEAAFLPISSVLAADRAGPEPIGVEVLYLSPLKALINDQFDRLDQLCEVADIPVHRWHGDVSQSAKGRVLRRPEGVLLITPESLEALFINRGTEVSAVLAGLRYLVVDELHSFLATPRGAQLQSLMNRVELAIRRRVPRIGLSATLGDMNAAAAFLRPSGPERVELIVSESDQREVRVQVRGHRAGSPNRRTADAASIDDAWDPIADHLYRHLRGNDNLIFANSRGQVELFADLLTQRCISEGQPNEFWPHHGSLSKDMRESVETALKEPGRAVTAICTSTLEMGIDIGTIDSVAQIDPPPSVASLRQRLGRSGRRDDAPSIMRLYITENEIDGRIALTDELRCSLVQTIAMVRLMFARWTEAPADPGLNLSTLVQQTLSVIAQHGGATAVDLHQALCGPGPFELVDRNRFARLLRTMAANGLVMQAPDGTLLHGPNGERAVNHYSFYTAFTTVQEWRLSADGQTLGTLPIGHPMFEGTLIVFAGRRWEVVHVEPRSRVVELRPAAGGRPPRFGESGQADVTDRVRQEMVQVYRGTDVPQFLNAEAAELLAEGRGAWRRLRLDRTTVLADGADTFVLPWLGDRASVTATLALASVGVKAAAEGPVLRAIGSDIGALRKAASELLEGPSPDPISIARRLENTVVDKWDHVLDEDLAAEATAARLLDLDGAWRILRSIVDSPVTEQPTAAAASARPTRMGHASLPFDDVEFSVIDVETTGISPRLGDRVVEIAVVRMRGDGTLVDEWSTLVRPNREIASTAIHGITPDDVREAPTFADIAGDLLSRLRGAVLTGHNIRFDRDFVEAELELAGCMLPPLPTLCTLGLVARLRPGEVDLRLASCCSRIGYPVGRAHSALADARAAAALLRAYLPEAVGAGATRLDQLGCDPMIWPEEWPALPPLGLTRFRPPVVGSPDANQAATYLARVVARLQPAGAVDPRGGAYQDAVARAVERSELTDRGLQALQAAARNWGLGPIQTLDVQRGLASALRAAAEAERSTTAADQVQIDDIVALLMAE